MKKSIHILIIALYTFLNMGLVVNAHYCCGKIDSISLFSAKAETCKLCGKKKMSNKCCKDTKTQISTEDDQINHQVILDLTSFLHCIAILPQEIHFLSNEFESISGDEKQISLFETGPPKTPIYIQIRSLLI